MLSPEIARDGSLLLATLTSPARALGEVAARRRSLVALAVATFAALAFAAVAVPRIDHQRAAEQQMGPTAGELTEFQRAEKVAQVQKLGAIRAFSGAVFGPTLLALGAAAGLFLGFRIAGAKPSLKGTFAVTAYGMLPVWLGQLLAIPALVARAPVDPAELPKLLPSSLAAFAPERVPPALLGFLSALDLFALWSLALVVAGMAKTAGVSKRRAAAVTVVLWLAYVAVAKVALPAAMAAQGGGRGGRGGQGGPEGGA
jgi:hypothetical protein